ncbi:pentraxin fusion protein-like [Macrobrachium nipponense]|uniref:pentraxin fusion protein-like n=1 Tax=Macrobrachium nipponense TaxID=159736 RepID=UPI0030C7D013
MSRLETGCGCLGRGSASQIPYGNLPANFGMPSPEMLHDMAPGKNTFGSSVSEGERPEKVTDGNDNSYFHSIREKRPWWVIDLGSERVIYHIMILTRQNCCSERLHDLEIRLGNNLEMNGDFSSYDLLYFYRGPYRKEEGFLMYTFAQGVKGRYLSLQIVAEEAEFLQLSTRQSYRLRN